MRKLLTLSVLAATLASTAVFAQPTGGNDDPMGGKGGMIGGNGGKQKNLPVRLIVANNAAPAVLTMLRIAQAFIDNAGPDNRIQNAIEKFKDDGSLDRATIVFVTAISSERKSATLETIMKAAAFANKQAGFKFIIVKQGSGDVLCKLHIISHIQDNNTVTPFEVKVTGKKIEIVQSQLDQNVADELINLRKAAKFNPVNSR